MSRIAKVLGKAQDANDYSDKLKMLKDSFNEKLYDAETGSYGSQTGNAMALEIGIVPEENKKKVAAAIVKNIHEEFDGFINRCESIGIMVACAMYFIFPFLEKIIRLQIVYSIDFICPKCHLSLQVYFPAPNFCQMLSIF